jgi:hypothetical protein
MAFKKVDTIKVGNLSPGRFAGGFIYGANFTVGGVSKPSTLSLSVVDEGPQKRSGKDGLGRKTKRYDGFYSSRTNGGLITAAGEDLSIRPEDEYDIQVGEEKSGLMLKMCLISYSEQKTQGEHVMTFEFVDTSHILDRVFIGLPNRHQKAHVREGRYYLRDLEAICPNCWTGVANRKVTASMIALRDLAQMTASTNVSIDKKMEVNWQTNPISLGDIKKYGGIITCGREEFIDHGSSGFKPLYTETEKYNLGDQGTFTVTQTIEGEIPCDVPNVTYKFIDLLSAMKYALGIDIRGLKVPPCEDDDGIAVILPTWENCGLKNDYRQSYTGTLREVLNNWCADFGYGFVWDFPEEKYDRILSFIDLKVGVYSEFHEVKSLLEEAELSHENKVSDKPFLVKELNYSKSMSDTYSHNYMSYYLKPHRPKTFSPFAYFGVNFYCLKVNDVFTAASCGIPNTIAGWNNFLISCMLAKFDTTARKVFNASIRRWHAIGHNILFDFSNSSGSSRKARDNRILKEHLFSVLDSSDLGELLTLYDPDNYWKGKKGMDFSHVNACIAVVNDDANSEWEQFESSIADNFLGKHYIANPEAAYGAFDLAEFEACLPTLHYKQSVEMNPSANKLSAASEVPWASLAAKAPVSLRGGNAILSKWLNNQFVSKLYHFEIGAEWGTSQDTVDNVFKLNPVKGKDMESALGWYDSLAEGGWLWDTLASYSNNHKDIPFKELFQALNDFYAGRNWDTQEENDQSADIPQLLVFSDSYIQNKRTVGKPGLGFKVVPAPRRVNPFASVASATQVVASECSIRCETGLLETMCRCPSEEVIEMFFKQGLEGRMSAAAQINYKGRFAPVIFPVNSGINSNILYKGFAKRQQDVRVLLEGQKLVLGDDPKYNTSIYKDVNSPLDNLPKNTMAIRLTAQDITNDADVTFQNLMELQKGVGGPIDAPATLVKVVVPDASTGAGEESGTGRGGEKMITLEDYHKSIKNFLTSKDQEHLRPTENLSFSLVGSYYDIEKLRYYLNPSKGLTEFNISFGQDGLTTSFTFSTRPSQLPEQETTMRKLGPTVWKSWYH